MNQEISDRKTAVTVGVLFIFATLAGGFSAVLLQSAVNDPDYLISFSSNEGRVITGAILDLIGAGAFVGHAVAIGYIVARCFEAVPFIIANISLLSLLSLSHQFVGAEFPNASSFIPVGTATLATYDWTQLIGPRILASLADRQRV